MKFISKPILAFALGVGASAVPLTASATNGYMGIGYGQVSLGMGGAT
ncbi:MAG: hypothetical protein HY052_09445, partial [Proteobacteria bacterium]|nr:hypothetical protein [Pseudomonadota bacterium]